MVKAAVTNFEEGGTIEANLAVEDSDPPNQKKGNSKF